MQFISLFSKSPLACQRTSTHVLRQATRSFSSTIARKDESGSSPPTGAPPPANSSAPKQPSASAKLPAAVSEAPAARTKKPSASEITERVVNSFVRGGSRAAPPPAYGLISNFARSMAADKNGRSSDLSGMREEERHNTQAAKNILRPPHQIHVYAHKHNTHVTVTKPNGDVMLSYSNGTLGFRKSQRSKYDASYQLAAYTLGKIQEKGFLINMNAIEVSFRGFGPGRDAFTKALLGQEGRNVAPLVSQVRDATRLKHGGTRSPRVRRLG